MAFINYALLAFCLAGFLLGIVLIIYGILKDD